MTVAEQVVQALQQLPEPLQFKVLDFVEYLLAKAQGQAAQDDEHTWSNLSLSLAMRGMEIEPTPEYTAEDMKEVFA
ncbi:MAG: DUF2281 domain-containing protein [Chloroflexi bacterium]|nr:DUF2281 domain-containing protein [Chloroflexota bacterium]